MILVFFVSKGETFVDSWCSIFWEKKKQLNQGKDALWKIKPTELLIYLFMHTRQIASKRQVKIYASLAYRMQINGIWYQLSPFNKHWHKDIFYRHAFKNKYIMKTKQKILYPSLELRPLMFSVCVTRLLWTSHIWNLKCIFFITLSNSHQMS